MAVQTMDGRQNEKIHASSLDMSQYTREQIIINMDLEPPSKLHKTYP